MMPGCLEPSRGLAPAAPVEPVGHAALAPHPAPPGPVQRPADEVDARPSPHGHRTAAARWAGVPADHLRPGPDARARCELAGRPHGRGKVVAPGAILPKPGPPTGQGWGAMRQHPAQGARPVALGPRLGRAATVVRQRHGRHDGTGHPDRRAGQGTTIEARVLAVCDTWAAMPAGRCYRLAPTREAARAGLAPRGRGGYAAGVVSMTAATAVGSGTGSPCSRSPSRWKAMASRIWRSASSIVSPSATQPGRSGAQAP